MNKSNITFEDLQSRIINFIDNAKSSTSKTEFTFEIDKDLDKKIIFT